MSLATTRWRTLNARAQSEVSSPPPPPGRERRLHPDQGVGHPARRVQELQGEGSALVRAAAAARRPAHRKTPPRFAISPQPPAPFLKLTQLAPPSPSQCPDRPWADRQWGLCIFDDVVEHCSPSSFKYASYFLGQMLQSLGDLRPEVRQAAAYGVGVMAQYGGDSYTQYCTGGTPPRNRVDTFQWFCSKFVFFFFHFSLFHLMHESWWIWLNLKIIDPPTLPLPPEAIPLLVSVIQAPDSRSKENINATENCVSAVGKVMRFRPACVDVGKILLHWLDWLPLKEDKEEAVHTFDFLCDLIER